MIGDTAPKRWRITVDFLAVLTAASLFVSGWALYSRFNETNAARARNAQIWHAVICDIEEQIVADNHTTRAEKARYLAFYDTLLVKDAHAKPCGIKLPGR